MQDAWAGDVPGEDVPDVGALAMHVDALGALDEGVGGEEVGDGQGGVGIQVADERNLAPKTAATSTTAHTLSPHMSPTALEDSGTTSWPGGPKA